MKASPSAPVERIRRSGTILAAFILGLPMAAGILAAVEYAPPEFILKRYLSHPVEQVEVVLFCCALGTLFAKLRQSMVERRACSHGLLGRWDGKAVPVDDATKLLAALDRTPRRLHNTFLFQRIAAILEFLVQRRSTVELDDHLRTLTDTDGITLDASYSLTRFITWAIPILGFLGTVLGITGAIANVSPESLESQGIKSVTNGLALAFDATALALSLTMITMFLSFLVERSENGVLEKVDRLVDRQLAHRFLRTVADSAPVIAAMESQTQSMLAATLQLVQQQAELWAKSMAEIERKTAEAQTSQTERLAAALDTALDRTLKIHAQRLAGMEQQFLAQSIKIFDQMGQVSVAVRSAGQEQLVALERVAKVFAAQVQSLQQVQQGEKHLVQLQTVLQQNLNSIAGTGAFERTLHTLNAAIHLLTARVGDSSTTTALPLAAPISQAVPTPTGKAA